MFTKVSKWYRLKIFFGLGKRKSHRDEFRWKSALSKVFQGPLVENLIHNLTWRNDFFVWFDLRSAHSRWEIGRNKFKASLSGVHIQRVLYHPKKMSFSDNLELGINNFLHRPVLTFQTSHWTSHWNCQKNVVNGHSKFACSVVRSTVVLLVSLLFCHTSYINNDSCSIQPA